MDERLQNQIIWIIEAAKVSSYILIKYYAPPKEILDQTVSSRRAALKEFVRVFRPFFYIMAIILWGRESFKPLAVSLVMDLLSDRPTWGTYILRYPLKDMLVEKVLPSFFSKILESYSRHLSYIL